MKNPLQNFGFKQSRYERPNQKWVCGWAAEGKACLSGPDARGRCQATSECRPSRKGDRWLCQRPASLGGPCQDGPKPEGACSRPIPPCSPVRSWRARRGLVVAWTLAATCGVMLFLVGGSARWRFVSPGSLSSKHALPELKCSDCHGGPRREISSTLSPSQDNRLCLNCHSLGPTPLLPHGLPSQTRAALTRQKAAKPMSRPPVTLALSSALFSPSHDPETELACARCHQEHLGREHPLTRLADAQCQACHARQFDSFAHGHPLFDRYPYTRRTRIIFDHAEHLKHFLEPQYTNQAPRSCSACHQPDDLGRTMLLEKFDAVCATCHARKIQDPAAPGLVFLRLPGLDVDTLTKSNIFIGEWPTTGDDEGELTPFMRLLLSGYPSARAALQTLAHTRLNDLSKANADELEAVRQLVWAIKGLIYDLAFGGPPVLREGLLRAVPQLKAQPASAITGADTAPESQLAGLTAGLPLDLLLVAQRLWFTNLQTEVPAQRAGQTRETGAAKPMLAPGSEQKPPTAPAQPALASPAQSRSGWYVVPNEYAIAYRPIGHNDPFLRAWLELSALAEAGSPLARIFKETSDPKAPGICAKCHSIDREPDQTLKINWKPALPSPPQESLFTKFSHKAHFPLLDRMGCESCHKLQHDDPKAEYQKAFEENFDPARFHSSFARMDQPDCARCHKPDGAADHCLACHNYHIGVFSQRMRP